MKRHVHLLCVVYPFPASLMATRAAQPDEVRDDTESMLAESRSGRVVRDADVYGFTSYCRRVREWCSIMNSYARYTLSLWFRGSKAVVSRTLAPVKYFDAKKSLSVTAKLIFAARVRIQHEP